MPQWPVGVLCGVPARSARCRVRSPVPGSVSARADSKRRNCWQFDLSPSDLKHIDRPDWIVPVKGEPTLMLFSVVDDRSGTAYQEYRCQRVAELAPTYRTIECACRQVERLGQQQLGDRRHSTAECAVDRAAYRRAAVTGREPLGLGARTTWWRRLSLCGKASSKA